MNKLILLFCVFTGLCKAQVLGSVWDAPAIDHKIPAAQWDCNQSKRPVPLPFLREADIAWSKKIWRIIDLREKFNLPYYYPLYPTNGCSSLFDVLKNGIFTGKINCYSANDDEFAQKFSVDEIKKRMVKIDTSIFYETNERGEEHEIKTIINDTVGSADILQYWVKEVFFFDSKRSVLDVRIIGICPVKYDRDKEMYIPLFWVYFNEIRPVLSAAVSINDKNDKERRNFDELFMKRKFHSFIYKEGNVYDRSIGSYAKGMDALLESDKITNQLRNLECDLWQN
ncbi:MAG: gliding motility protein GldN [Bacteroidia bacterium]|nr:gliding motility protein GldN [Bacteroidia bacterium]